MLAESLANQRFSAIKGGLNGCFQHPPALTKPTAVESNVAEQSLCILRECGNRAANGRLGFCNSHYKKYWRHGNPRGGRKTKRARNGEPTIWLLAHVDHAGDECLIWPFAQRGNGYGILTGVDGRHGRGAHRYMCELAHGPPPSPRHLAAHGCGKGAEGCVNPKHLRWATPAENSADRLIHGTGQRGNSHPCAKLSERDVATIRREWPSRTQCELAAQFGVHQSTIWKVLHRKVWLWP